jgi:P4 family phage/plasmid primase-like protien
VALSNPLNKIKTFYEGRNEALVKNVKSLATKLYKPSFEKDIIEGAKMYYDDERFVRFLNSKKHLVPFTNGVYDLLQKCFRVTTHEDYVNLTTGFDFNPDVNNPEVWNFINQVLPNIRVRDYVLKKMSDCLNGDIPNTIFLMFIGDGANGKSQLLNLMKLTLGELAEKVEVTLLTRKRNNANEANTEKIKLMNKRFAFLSEPEDGEKINIGLLKELTGSEEIVARGLYQASVSFVMETKLFLACNELPEIKGEDTALWRRIRVVDFPSRFVDEPKEDNEYAIDRTLPARMREDVTWKQTFMNILVEYYHKTVGEPEEVMMSTSNYRANNDIIMQFVESKCIIDKHNKAHRIFTFDLWHAFTDWLDENDMKPNLKQHEFYKRVDKLTGYDRTKKVRVEGKNSHGWYGISIKPHDSLNDDDNVGNDNENV